MIKKNAAWKLIVVRPKVQALVLHVEGGVTEPKASPSLMQNRDVTSSDRLMRVCQRQS